LIKCNAGRSWRVLADRKPVRARFLVLGSAAPDLLRQRSESLAGRLAYYDLPGLALREVGVEQADHLWVRGGFPKSFLARSDRESMEWRQASFGLLSSVICRPLA